MAKAPSKSGTWVGKTHIPGRGGTVRIASSVGGGRSSGT